MCLIGAFDDDTIHTQEHAFKVNVFFKTVDTALMQLKERFSDQQLVTSTFNILFPSRLARASNDEISKKHKQLAEPVFERFYRRFGIGATGIC